MLFSLILHLLINRITLAVESTVNFTLPPVVGFDSWDSTGSPCKCDVQSNECECMGWGMYEMPDKLPLTNFTRLTIRQTSIAVIPRDFLRPYRSTVEDITFSFNGKLNIIQPDAFRDLPNLTSIYIYNSDKLEFIADEVFRVNLNSLKALRITNCGLKKLPRLTHLETNKSTISIIDFENNKITNIATSSVRLNADDFSLAYNLIRTIEARAFNGSKIGKLNLRGNKKLTTIHSLAFQGMVKLVKLDVSDTSITVLPTAGFHELNALFVEDVLTLKTFPSVYNFPSISKVHLTYPFHCCAFKYPGAHDPERYAKHEKLLAEQLKACTNGPENTFGYFKDLPDDGFHPGEVTLKPGTKRVLCGNISKDYGRVQCYPEPDAFNPCEDIMGNWTLRVAVWFVAIAALLGNTAVLLVLVSSRFRMTVPKFLMCNLALADLCMGLYLLMIAIEDAKTIGEYFNNAIDWQRGPGCQMAGFLTVFSSVLSVLTLTVITSERWYTITYAIHMNKRLKLSTASKIMALGWVYAIIMAGLPLLGVSGYHKTSICLPLVNRNMLDMSYLIVLLSFNGFAFWLICICYAKMYCTISKGRAQAGPALVQSDMTVAKRMALLVFTDFACWAPIAFFGLTALAGVPLIDLTKTKILLVFFYPLNSCANPYLYALLTHQYRRDVLVLLSRYGICSKRAARYKGAAPGEVGVGGGGTGRSHRAPRGSILTTLTSLDCTRQSSLGSHPEGALGLDNGSTTV